MTDCRRCGKDRKDLRAHMLRVHPEEYWLPADGPRPHGTAQRITIESETCEDGWHERVTMGEWHTERYGFRQHGWFIPVEVKDGHD